MLFARSYNSERKRFADFIVIGVVRDDIYNFLFDQTTVLLRYYYIMALRDLSVIGMND